MDKRGFPMGDPRAKGGTEEDIGLQVGPKMWRWPSMWPYPPDFFDTVNSDPLDEWVAAHPEAEEGPFVEGSNLEALQAHLSRHLPKDARILDLGAGRRTPLPVGFPVAELAGVGASAAGMAANPALSSAAVVDLNDPELRLPFEGKPTQSLPQYQQNAALFWQHPKPPRHSPSFPDAPTLPQTGPSTWCCAPTPWSS